MNDVERLEKATKECRAAVREAHQAAQDLKAMVRDAKEMLSSKPVEAVIAAIIAQQLEKTREP